MLSDQPNWGALGLLESPDFYTKEDSTLKGHLRGIDKGFGAIAEGSYPHAPTHLPGGVDEIIHASEHEDDGDDEIAGDNLASAYSPSNWSTDGVDIGDQWSGIDTKIGTIDTALSGKASTDHDATHLPGGSDEFLHADEHESTGGDTIAGDGLLSAYSATAWTDGTTIGDQWSGIDTKLQDIGVLSIDKSSDFTNIDGPAASDLDGTLMLIDAEFGDVATDLSGKASTDHDTTHVSGGSDPIAGDSLLSAYDASSWVEGTTIGDHWAAIDGLLADIGPLAVDVAVSNYTPSTSVLDDYLTAIDTEIGNLDTDKLDASADIGPLLVDVSVSEYSPGSSTLDAYLSSIDTEFGNVDTAISGKAPNDHDTTHIDGGSDVIDADKLEVTWTPSNYTRDSTTPSETDADDQLTAHFQGVDTRLEVIEHLARNCVGGRIALTSTTALDWESVSSNEIGLYNGSEWVVVLDSSMPTIANTDTDLDGNALTVDSAYSVYIQYDSATSWSWQHQKWTSRTSRSAAATPYDFDGVLVEANNTDGKKRRYMGVLLTWDDGGTVKFYDGKLGRHIWNHYHQQKKIVWGGVQASTTWNYSTATWRLLNGNTSHLPADFILMEDRDILLNIGQGGVGSYGSSPYDALVQVAPAFNGTTPITNAMCDYQQYNGWYYSTSRSYVHETSGITPGRQYYNVMEKAASGVQVTLYGYSSCYVTFELEM